MTLIAPKMLIADDDPAILSIVADRCARAGFSIETATNGIQALIKAKQSHPDVLVIDYNMPGASGLAVCARLLEPTKKPLNVVLITGSQEAETAERCEGFGVFYVRKGAAFWEDLTQALSETFPSMAHGFKELRIPLNGSGTKCRPRILIVDDDPATEVFLRSRLNKVSVDTLFAQSAPQGFRTACKERPSVIISNYSMRDGDIYFLLGKLRTAPITQKIPIFVMTEWPLTESERANLGREVCGHPGVAHIFRKSEDPRELFEALQKIVAFEASQPPLLPLRSLQNGA